MYNDKKKKKKEQTPVPRVSRPKLLLLTSPCGEKSVCPLSHIRIVVEFRSLAEPWQNLSPSLCMAQTGVSQPCQIHVGWKEEWEEEEETLERDLDLAI